MDNKQEQIYTIVHICNRLLLSDNTDASEYQLPELSLNDWNSLFTLASLHGMLPAVMSLFENRKMDDQSFRDLIIRWFGIAQMDIYNYRMRINTMRELAEMFAEESIDIMFFKGAALAQFYPYPERRVFSDIDFYLYGRWKDALSVFTRHNIENAYHYHHNTKAVMHNILLENHYDFLDCRNHKQNLILDKELKQLADEEGRSINASFLGEGYDNAYVMTPTMNAIFLIKHMSVHFVAESVPLRMFYDWMLFLRHHAKDVDWIRVEKLYQESCMTEFVGIVQGLIQKYFAVEIPDCPIIPLMNEKTEKVWKSIISPPAANPYKENGIRYYLYETKVFMANRWKHKIVYPGESYILLFIRYIYMIAKAHLCKSA